mmetsp:Transcript_116178/g.329228  ORF Transcript_116178/g.329228 Transcript_116178/m.329228 type:complete len:362 (-) Transcript_116178:341-1426(-)
MLRIQHAVQLLIGRSLQIFHELHHRLLLAHEEPLDALAHVLHVALQRGVRLGAQELHHDVPPCERVHRDTACLDHVSLCDLAWDLGETDENLSLDHQPPELGAAVELHVEGADLHLVPEVLDVVLEAVELLGRKQAEVLGTDRLVVEVEVPQLLLQAHDGVQAEGALHDVRQGRGEGDAAVAGGAQDALRVGVAELRRHLLLGLLEGRLEALQVAEDRTDGVHEDLLDPLLHEAHEVLEADGLQVLRAEAPRLHLPEILGVHLLPQFGERLGGHAAVLPPGEREREAHQVLGQVAEAVHPLVHVVRREVVVVLVELVADQDRPLELRVQLAAPRERGHGRRVPALLDAQHHVAGVPHEAHD